MLTLGISSLVTDMVPLRLISRHLYLLRSSETILPAVILAVSMRQLCLCWIPQLLNFITDTSHFEFELRCSLLHILTILVELVWHEAMGQRHLRIKGFFFTGIFWSDVLLQIVVVLCHLLLLLLLNEGLDLEPLIRILSQPWIWFTLILFATMLWRIGHLFEWTCATFTAHIELIVVLQSKRRLLRRCRRACTLPIW